MKALRRQRACIGQPRAKVSASVAQAIDREVNRTAKRFGVSRSFVRAVAMAHGLGMEIDAADDYRPHTNRLTFRVYDGRARRRA